MATRVSAVTKNTIALTVVIARTKLVTRAESKAGFNKGKTIKQIVLKELPFNDKDASSKDLSNCPNPAIAARIPTGILRITIDKTTINAVPVI